MRRVRAAVLRLAVLTGRRGDLPLLDELPEFGAFFKFVVILDIEVGSDKEIAQRVSVEDVVDDKLVAVFLEVDPVILESAPINRPPSLLDRADAAFAGFGLLFPKSRKFRDNLELVQLVELGKFGGRAIAEHNLVHGL